MKRIAFLLTMVMLLVLLVACTEPTPETYTVDFVLKDETISQVYEKGVVPTPPTVEDYEMINQVYSFSGWDKEIVAVTEDTTYTAQYTGAPKQFDVTFIYGGATTGTAVKVAWGATPTAPTTGLNYETADKIYTFIGWDKAISPITADTVYTAEYTSVLKEFDVTFVYEGGSKSSTVTYKYGETPVAPTQTGDYYHTVEKTFTFSGWDKTIAAVTGDVTYTATYTEAPRSYVITFVVLGQETTTANLAYGATITLPTPAATVEKDGKTYTFVGWDNDATTVSGDAIYTAVYTLPALYSQNFNDQDFDKVSVENSTANQVLGDWTLTINKSGAYAKTLVDPNNAANKFCEIGATDKTATVQANIKGAGLAIGDCTKLTISVDLGKKNDLALSDTYIRFRSSNGKFVKFFESFKDGTMKFCGKAVEGVTLSETLQTFSMEFDFAAEKATLYVNGTAVVVDAALDYSATGYASMLEYVKACTGYVFNWAFQANKADTHAILVDNLSIVAHT